MKKYIIPILLLAALLSSCEDIVQVDLNDEDKGFYTVEATISTIDEPYVRIRKALPVNADEELPGVSGALVTLSDNATPANEITLTESNQTPGLYEVPLGTSYLGKVNRVYTLSITTADETMVANEELFPVEPMDSMKVFPSMRGDGYFLGIFTYGQETPGPGNNYKWDVFINDTLVNEAEYIMVASDELVDGNYVNGLEVFTDFHNPNDPSERRLKYQDKVVVEQKSLSEFAYNYYVQLLNQSFTGNMFSVPPANIPSNFITASGKEVLGLFTAHDISVSEPLIIDESIENQLQKN